MSTNTLQLVQPNDDTWLTLVEKDGVASGAEFSSCGKYRYQLFRHWDKGGVMIMFLMLNPSTATELKNDPTVERCERRARAMGYGGFYVGNLFALRSTDPMALYGRIDPVGEYNDARLLSMAARCDVRVCGWGQHGNLGGRGKAVEQMLRSRGFNLHALTINKDGTPRHPLYVGYNQEPKLWA